MANGGRGAARGPPQGGDMVAMRQPSPGARHGLAPSVVLEMVAESGWEISPHLSSASQCLLGAAPRWPGFIRVRTPRQSVPEDPRVEVVTSMH